MTANVRHSSEHSDFMTPEWLTDKARYVLGGRIGLDPASDHFANRTVRADRIFTKEENGLYQPWDDWIWLNPPGGLIDATGREVIRKSKKRRGCTETGSCGLPPGHKHEDVNSSAAFWWHKFMHEHESGRCPGGIFLGFSLELLQSAQSFIGRQPLCFPSCVPRQRIRFELEVDGKRVVGRDPTHANLVVLVVPGLPPSTHRYDSGYVDRFEESFSQVGSVHVPRGY